MPLSAGGRLGPYEILALIGSGGMGEVYKARDPRLGREVAIKLLHTGKLARPDRTARFLQEARAASALNHPHIITIYDIGSEAGADFLVMEYVKGKPLDHLIPRSGMPVREVLRLCGQVADALSKAHSAGIIHRDVKPSNLMVTGDGQIKVLDFGLAKLTDPGESSELDPTLTERPRTEDGTILGTLSYMSPEQTEGKKLDARTDIFSFGAVMYEMLTGRPAFSGSSKASIMAAILREDPKPAHELVAGIPPELERIVNRAMRKDPARRFQHMDDLKVELEELKEESDSGRLSTSMSPAAPAPKRKWRAAAWIAAVCVLAAAALLLRGRITPSPRTLAVAPVRLTSDAGLTSEPAIWAAGNLIAYASDRAGDNLDIWVQQLQSGEARRLTTNAADDHEPDFSPDGSKIVFRSERDGGGIYLISTLGGTEQKITDRGHSPKFSPDGAWIAYWIGEPAFRRFVTAFRGQVMIVPARGGDSREVTTGRLAGIEPVWAPDSKHLLFMGWDEKGNADAYAVPIDSGEPVATRILKVLEEHKLTNADFGAWSGNQIIVTAQAGDSRNLWRLALDPRTFRVSGAPERLTAGASMDSHPAVGGGRLLFSSVQENSDVWYLPIDTDRAKVTGDPHRVTAALTQEMNGSLTDDGSRVVYGSLRADGADMVLHDLATGHSTIIASGAVPRPLPRISPDGSRISYYWLEAGKNKSFVVPAPGGVPEAVCEDCAARAWTHDGKRLLISRGANRDTGLLDIATRQFRLIVAGLTTSAPRTSWDDRWLTFTSIPLPADPRHTQMYIVPVQDGGATPRNGWIEATDGSAFDVDSDFSPNGNLLYFQSQRDGSRCLWALRLDPVTKRPTGEPFPVYHFHNARQSMTNLPGGTASNTVARNKIGYISIERTGNIWMIKLD